MRGVPHGRVRLWRFRRSSKRCRLRPKSAPPVSAGKVSGDDEDVRMDARTKGVLMTGQFRKRETGEWVPHCSICHEHIDAEWFFDQGGLVWHIRCANAAGRCPKPPFKFMEAM